MAPVMENEATLKVEYRDPAAGEVIRKHETGGRLVILRGRMTSERSTFEVAIQGARDRVRRIVDELTHTGARVMMT